MVWPVSTFVVADMVCVVANMDVADMVCGRYGIDRNLVSHELPKLPTLSVRC